MYSYLGDTSLTVKGEERAQLTHWDQQPFVPEPAPKLRTSMRLARHSPQGEDGTIHRFPLSAFPPSPCGLPAFAIGLRRGRRLSRFRFPLSAFRFPLSAFRFCHCLLLIL